MVLDEDKLIRIVNGGLKNAIDAHGPIHKNLISSASRRIVSNLIGVLSEISIHEAASEAVKRKLSRLRDEIKEKDLKIRSQGKQIYDLVVPHIPPVDA